MSKVITFYSYKGGVGRTMGLANTAVLLSKWGFKVLIVDWDLEAPGLEHFFKTYFDIGLVGSTLGVVDLLQEPELKWQDGLIPILIPEMKEPIHFISAGRRDEGYFKKVREFNVEAYYENGGGQSIEHLRDEWKEGYDFVLIDSRTGVTEIGGICTIQLPDQVVLLFTATDQGFDGTLDIAQRASKAQQKLPFDREKLVFIPIVTKFDTQAEFKLSREWIERFAEKLKPIYDDWLPLSIKRSEFIETTKIPYITYFSFGEKLPVIEQSTFDPAGLAYAYENLAGLLANELNDVESLIVARDKFIPFVGGSHSAFLEQNGGNAKNQKLKIFISYSYKNRAYLELLVSHLSILSRKHQVSFWTYDSLLPGENIEETISKNFEEAGIILVLISPDYFTSKFATDEMEKAIIQGKMIIPIYLERVADIGRFPISKFLGLPSQKFISEWENKDFAFDEIVTGIEKVIVSKFQKK